MKEKSKIYILCPSYLATGGTELLHQLHYELKILGLSSFIFYTDKTEEDPVYTNKRFDKYIQRSEVADFIEDLNDNYLIVPEVYIKKVDYKRINMLFWWLSVDNFLLLNGYRTENITKINIKGKIKIFLNMSPYNILKETLYKPNLLFHLYQSEYARLFLKKLGYKHTLSLSDYINEDAISIGNPIEKTNIIVFNPMKGIETVRYLQANSPANFEWIPIENMTPKEIGLLLARAKIYIDFGNHPGKDRIPREAVLNNCCIITNKEGAAKNKVDIPILPTYKFNDPILKSENFFELVTNIFEDFELHRNNFIEYKMMIQSEREKFIEDVEMLIKIIN